MLTSLVRLCPPELTLFSKGEFLDFILKFSRVLFLKVLCEWERLCVLLATHRTLIALDALMGVHVPLEVAFLFKRFPTRAAHEVQSPGVDFHVSRQAARTLVFPSTLGTLIYLLSAVCI